jgi:hypothetical protein
VNFLEQFSVPKGYSLSETDLHEGVPRALQVLDFFLVFWFVFWFFAED